MPWKVVEENNKFCVHKLDADGNVGETVSGGCHDTAKEARDHQAALYANEKKEKEQKGHVPYGVDTWEELEATREAQEVMMNNWSVMDDFMGLTRNILERPDIDDKAAAIEAVTAGLQDRLNKKTNEKEIDQPWHEYKEMQTDKAVWSTKYVNDLPNSSFLYVEPNCENKECRHLPYKDASGKIDLPHLRNAIARIPQMKGISSERKAQLQARARRLLEGANKEDQAFIERVANAVKKTLGMMEEKEQPQEYYGGMMIWKEGEQYRWFARYSNNFRDDDNPAEIISADSHRNFVNLVDSKQVDMPELWLWHVPEWRLGKADWVAYDDEGFALAAGSIDKGKEAFADLLSNQADLAVSHGMPTASIVRNSDDPTIIKQHITTEISPLPRWAAANKLTGFVILGSDDNKEDDMAIPANKREELVSKWGVSEHLLASLEEANSLDAAQAKEDGRESKEKEAQSDEEVRTEESQQVSETSQNSEETPEADPLAQPPTRQEVADSFATIVMPFVETLNEVVAQVNALTEEIKELKQMDDAKVKNIVASTPSASIAAMIAQRMSAVGSPETSVDGRTPLAKSKPKETTDGTDERLGIPFLDKMLTPAGESEVN